MKKIILTAIFSISLLFTTHTLASTFKSNIFLTDNEDAVDVCPDVCTNNYSNWTGKWWNESKYMSICECFHDWPFCPVVDDPGTPIQCVPQFGTADDYF
jgi:hypothetical protein